MSTLTAGKVVQTFLNFDGRCEEAVNFYCEHLGAEIQTLRRMKDSPDPRYRTGGDDQILDASFRIGETTIMASDCRCIGKPNFEGFSLALSATTVTEAERYFAALADGGTVEMPLQETFWSPRFGVVTDRFGVNWMINLVA